MGANCHWKYFLCKYKSSTLSLKAHKTIIPCQSNLIITAKIIPIYKNMSPTLCASIGSTFQGLHFLSQVPCQSNKVRSDYLRDSCFYEAIPIWQEKRISPSLIFTSNMLSKYLQCVDHPLPLCPAIKIENIRTKMNMHI